MVDDELTSAEQKSFEDERFVNRATFVFTAILVAGGLAFWYAKTRPAPFEGFCPMDGLILDDADFEPRRDPTQGCRWVDDRGELIFECPPTPETCNWTTEGPERAS